MSWAWMLLLKPLLLLGLALAYWVCIAWPVSVLQRRFPGHWLLRERGAGGAGAGDLPQRPVQQHRVLRRH